MKSPAIKIFGLWIGLLAGNFAYQAFGGQIWKQAIERSWFQLMAMIAIYIFIKVCEKPNE